MFPAQDIMTKNVLTVTKSTPVYEAIRVLVKNEISGLPVVDDNNKLVGLFTDKDALRLLQQPEENRAMVADFMTENVVKFHTSDRLIKICNCLIENPYRRVPIVNDDNEVVGLISRHDIMRQILEMRHMDIGSGGLQGEDA